MMRLALGGDTKLARGVSEALRLHGPAHPWDDDLLAVLVEADVRYWWPKMSGLMLNETWGKIGFACMYTGSVLAFTMHIAGAMGMPRRIGVYREEFIGLNQTITIGYVFTIVASSIVVCDVIASLRRKRDCGEDPWNVNDVQHSSGPRRAPRRSTTLSDCRQFQWSIRWVTFSMMWLARRVLNRDRGERLSVDTYAFNFASSPSGMAS